MLAADIEQVAVAAGGQQAGRSAGAAEEGVDADGVTVHDLEDIVRCHVDRCDARQHAVFLLWCRENFAVADLAGREIQSDDVGEGATDVDAEDPVARGSDRIAAAVCMGGHAIPFEKGGVVSESLPVAV